MKTVFACLLGLLSGVYGSHAQTRTLEFSQVLLADTGTTLTVPAGKVWKVESALSNSAVRFNDGYFMWVNGKRVYLNDYSSGPKFWSNIVSIDIEARKTLSCSGGLQGFFNFSGFESGFPVSNRTITLGNINNTTFTNIGTITPLNAGAILELTSIRLYARTTGASPWGSFEFNMIVNYADGSSQQYVYNYNSGSCANFGSGTDLYVLGSSGTPFSFSSTSRDFYTNPTKLPMWLPAGTTVRAGGGLHHLSIMEFNVNP